MLNLQLESKTSLLLAIVIGATACTTSATSGTASGNDASSQLETSSLSADPRAYATGETLYVSTQLLAYGDPHRNVELVGGDELVATVGTATTKLTPSTDSSGYANGPGYLIAKFAPSNDRTPITLELRRPEGKEARTWSAVIPETFDVVKPPASHAYFGDVVTVSLPAHLPCKAGGCDGDDTVRVVATGDCVRGEGSLVSEKSTNAETVTVAVPLTRPESAAAGACNAEIVVMRQHLGSSAEFPATRARRYPITVE